MMLDRLKEAKLTQIKKVIRVKRKKVKVRQAHWAWMDWVASMFQVFMPRKRKRNNIDL